jgi:hypothetical protein
VLQSMSRSRKHSTETVDQQHYKNSMA